MKKKNGILNEFKTFALRGNVIDLAVGVIIGAAFQKIVTSIVNDMITPLVSVFTGGIDFNERFLILKLPENVDKASVTSLSTAKELGVATFNYGSFITTVIDFIILAFIIFLMIKGINRMLAKQKKADDAPKTDKKKCEYCKTEIAKDASRCPNCTSHLEEHN